MALPSADTRVLTLLSALADEKRLRIVEILRGGERCVCHIQPALDISQPLLSHHLRVLREAGLVRDRRQGRWIHYALVPEVLGELGSWAGGVGRDAEATADEACAAACRD
ncbi:MAG: metalloregulator ArsR/SmtB family transcription factor [Gemmatimonadetes bacterium]|nr:metalloregulator ArsR/SmtB family transcription factor [Gemmatimonadota bacterium]